MTFDFDGEKVPMEAEYRDWGGVGINQGSKVQEQLFFCFFPSTGGSQSLKIFWVVTSGCGELLLVSGR